LLQTKLICYKLTKATLQASLSSSLLQKCDGGNAPLLTFKLFASRSPVLATRKYRNQFRFIPIRNRIRHRSPSRNPVCLSKGSR
jgi:hypothetical protein